MLSESGNKIQLSARAACFLMALIAISRGSSFLFSKFLLGTMEPLALLGLRFLIAFAVLSAIFFRKVIDDVRNDRHMINAALLLGTVYYLCMAAELYGLRYTTSSTCSLIENSAIVLVPIIEAFLLQRLPKAVIMLSAVMTLIGVALLVSPGIGASSAILGIGEALCIIAALLYAAAIIITDRLSRKHDPMTLGILYVGAMGVMGIMSSLFTGSPALPASGTEWIMLIFLAVLCTCLGFSMQPVAQKSISSETVGIIGALNPLTTATLGWVLLGEKMSMLGIAGAILIICGITLPNIDMIMGRSHPGS